MFKLLIIYPLFGLILLLILSDMEVQASLYKFSDNSISIRFPRAEWTEEPWFEFYWNAESIHKEVREMKEGI